MTYLLPGCGPVLLVLSLLLCFSPNAVKAQDIHFSQFLYSPMNLNPAMTGQFDGRYRLVFNYRNQWRSVSRPFQTISLSGDARRFLNLKRFNLGLDFYYDQAGTSNFQTIEFSVPISYELPLTATDTLHRITFGLQPGFGNQSINTDDLTFDDQYNGNRYDPDLASNESFPRQSVFYPTVSAGIAYHFPVGNSRLHVGAAGYNLNTPNVTFQLGTEKEIERRYNLHAGGHVPLGTDWFLTPGLVYSRQGTAQEFVFGTEINYLINSNRYVYQALFFGLWNRGNDAAITNLGMYYKSWRFALSYDVNYSTLNPASNYRGGWEVSVIYILRDLLPKRVPYKYCPNYI
ncbi:PorP/SprF family type IX secretion system membrane protein [bacterium SCSIO 12741]|nr:PorP/SprF family type IX secretion system membrane protein [bacterium SCSIO 12741]